MALPSNVQSYPSGSPLPFFSPFPVPGAAGVNLFAHLPHRLPLLFRNPYVFPPFILIPEVLRFITCLGFSCSFVVPDLRPRTFWWSLLRPYEGYLLAPKGAKNVVLPPTHTGFSTTWPLPWDLWVFRIIPVWSLFLLAAPLSLTSWPVSMVKFPYSIFHFRKWPLFLVIYCKSE